MSTTLIQAMARDLAYSHVGMADHRAAILYLNAKGYPAAKISLLFADVIHKAQCIRAASVAPARNADARYVRNGR